MIFKRFQMDWIMKENQCILVVPDFQTVSNCIPICIYRLAGHLKSFENRGPPPETRTSMVVLHDPILLKPFEEQLNLLHIGFGTFLASQIETRLMAKFSERFSARIETAKGEGPAQHIEK